LSSFGQSRLWTVGKPYNASGATRAEVDVQACVLDYVVKPGRNLKQTSFSLTASGYIIGEVQRASGPVSSGSPRYLQIPDEWVHMASCQNVTICEDQSECGRSPFLASKTLPEILWRSLVGNRRTAKEYNSRGGFRQWQEGEAPENWGKIITDSYFFTMDELRTKYADEDIESVMTAWLIMTACGKAFAIIKDESLPHGASSEEQYFGLLPKTALPGSFICILHGCSVPLALSRCTESTKPGQGARYHLIGECYVHGLMEGQIIEEAKKRGIKPQKITLT
jgi:hypothetical protein